MCLRRSFPFTCSPICFWVCDGFNRDRYVLLLKLGASLRSNNKWRNLFSRRKRSSFLLLLIIRPCPANNLEESRKDRKTISDGKLQQFRSGFYSSQIILVHSLVVKQSETAKRSFAENRFMLTEKKAVGNYNRIVKTINVFSFTT